MSPVRHAGPRPLQLLLLVVTLFTAATAGASTVVRPVNPLPSFLGYVPDQFIVVFDRGTAHQLMALPPTADRARANLPQVQAVLDRIQARGFERQFPTARPQPLDSRFPEMTGHYRVKLAPGQDLEAAMAEFHRDQGVARTEKIGIHTLDATPNDTYYLNLTPPPGFPWKQWHYWDTYGIDADLAWDLESGDQTVAVGIVDSGIRYFHADLGGSNAPGPADNSSNGNIWVNPSETPGGGDDDGNGFVNDVIGWDFVSGVLLGANCRDPDCATPDNDPMDGEGHGTHVAGTVGAITNNGNRAAGVAGGFGDGTTAGAATGVKLIPLRIGYHTRVQGIPTGVVSMDWAAQAMNYVADLVDSGINVAAINCSWGSSNSGGISTAVANLQAHDVLVVASAGNSNVAVTSYLPTLPGVLCIGASDSLGMGADFSNFGPQVDLAAPGVHVLSTYSPNQDDGIADGDYVALLDGTSMSTPHVVGVAALLESYNPALTAADKAALIINNTSPFAPGNTKVLGSGILNARLALNAATPLSVTDDIRGAKASLALKLWPNPARAGSQFSLQAKAGERVTITLLDAAGRRVREIGATGGVAGTRVSWDGRDALGHRVPAGLYFATARAGERSATLRFVVID